MNTRHDHNSRTVYSTEHGTLCPACSQPVAACVCTRASARPAGDGVVRVGRETKGRHGKSMTVITGLPLGQAELQQLAKQLKQQCGSGGTVKDGAIAIQGDHRDAVIEALTKHGYVVKRAGG